MKKALDEADTVVIGAGAGLSTSAGLAYDGARFQKYFGDFSRAYGIQDMYSGGFYPFETLEEYWAWWSRHIMVNRYVKAPKPVYEGLLTLVQNKEYFVLTTNVDHQFQLAGFDKTRLFYTQGDYGLWQCGKPCHQATYANEAIVHRMVKEQKDRKIPSELIPRCPKCGAPMTMNLRCDDTFVQDEGWYRAAGWYRDFLGRHQTGAVLYLELGVGNNTPGIIKVPFWQMTARNPKSVYTSINLGQSYAPAELSRRSLCIDGDIGTVLRRCLAAT